MSDLGSCGHSDLATLHGGDELRNAVVEHNAGAFDATLADVQKSGGFLPPIAP